MRRILSTEATAPRQRVILDEEVLSRRVADKSKGERKTAKHVVETPDGKKPLPVTHRRNRQFVGIVPGQLVRVSGERDTKFVVVSEPYREIRGERIPVTTRVAGAHPSLVDLLGPDGPRTVRLGWCIPFHG